MGAAVAIEHSVLALMLVPVVSRSLRRGLSNCGDGPASPWDEEADRADGQTSGVPDSDASFEALLDEKVCRCADVHAVELRPKRCVEIGSVESEQDAGAGG